MKKATIICSIWLACAPIVAIPASAAPHTPAKGSSERIAIMNAARRVLGSGRHKAIITPDHLKVESGWAYLTGDFNYEGGAKLEPEYTQGSGTHFSTLLHKEKGSWRIKRRVYNGDVEEPQFMHDFPNAPKAIFRMN